MVIDSQQSVMWDTTKTIPYQKEISIYLIYKNTGIVHIKRHQEGERVLSNSGVFYIFG